MLYGVPIPSPALARSACEANSVGLDKMTKSVQETSFPRLGSRQATNKRRPQTATRAISCRRQQNPRATNSIQFQDESIPHVHFPLHLLPAPAPLQVPTNWFGETIFGTGPHSPNKLPLGAGALAVEPRVLERSASWGPTFFCAREPGRSTQRPTRDSSPTSVLL